MYLKSLELAGFKSFAKKEKLDFKSPVTGIVGPNGSGKSNVAESFRFVLGEQSMKSLRGKRGEDLIWNGSEKEPRANRASVKAIFDNSKRIFNIDFDEVSVERVVSRDGANEYSINGSQVRLRDVLELLAQANIGSSGHHIISQGEADRILSANIKERKEMVEDALGLKSYQYKREESLRKLAKTEENMNQVEALRREIAPHLRFLKKQVEKMGKAVEVKDKLASLYKEYLKRESQYLEKFRNEIGKQKEPLLLKKKHLEEEMHKARLVLSSSGSKDGKSQKLLEVEARVFESRKEKESLERELGKIEGEVSANQRIIENEKIKAENSEKNIPLVDIENLVQDVFSDYQRVESENNPDSLKKILKSIKEKLWNFIEKSRGAAIVSMARDLEFKNQELAVKKSEIENNFFNLDEKLKNLDLEYKEVKKGIEAEKDSERGAEMEMFRISSEEAKVQGEINVLKSKEENLKKEEEDFGREAREAIVLMGNMISGFQDTVLVPRSDSGVGEEDRKFQKERQREVEKMKIRLEELGASGGEEIIKEHKDAEERDGFLEKELSDLKISGDSLRGIISDLDEKLNIEFKEGVRKINDSFGNFFSLMFGGGEAKLEVIENSKLKIENLDEEESEKSEKEKGIDINVSLPRKRIKGLQMLSGGERALTSIALLFALSQVNPPPFIILDETDAALDEANSKKYGDMIENLSKYSQLILITHNRETMSRAGVIYGVTVGTSGASKLLSIAFDEAVSVAK